MKKRAVTISVLLFLTAVLNYQFVIPNIGGDPSKKVEKKKGGDGDKKKNEKKKSEQKKSEQKSEQKKVVKNKKVVKSKKQRYLESSKSGEQNFTHYDTTANDSFYWSYFGRGAFKVYKKDSEELVP